jgi:hypothetical protein
MLINISSSGGMNVLVETRTGVNFQSSGAWSTVGTYSLSGWSGWNDIPLVLGTLGGGTTQTGNNWQLRLTFIMTSKNTTYPTTANVDAIRIFGENAWTVPSTLAGTNDLYTYDMSQNAFFPAAIQGSRLTSTVATGTAPLTVSSTTAVTNLNADLLDGLHSTAFVPARTRSDWNNATSVIGNVIGELAWKNYGNGHTIFDASNSTAPGGTAKNNTNPDIFWSATYPTLMGWNGTNTYGVRVDSARVSDSTTGNAATATTLQTARTINGVSFNGSANITVTAAPNAHTHAISDVTGLQTAIDARIPLTQKGAASGVVPLNSSSKIDETYLPNFIFGGMRYIGSISGNTTAESLLDAAQTYIASNGGTVSGCYFIVSGTVTVTITGGVDTNNGVSHTFTSGPFNMIGEEGDNNFDTIDLEPGDWIVINDTWGPYFSVTYQRWSVVNNTYALVTTTDPGIMSAADKTKLDGIASSANNYTHPTGGANSTISNANGLVLSSITVNTLGHVTAVGSKTLAAADIPTLNQNTTGSAATLTTARTLTIGSTGKTFNGGANVSWTLAEIGAQVAGSYADTSHTHGNITNAGTITSDTAIASGQKIVLVNASNQIVRSTLALGTATTTFLRNDGQWVTPAGGGDVVGPASSTTGRVATFNGTTGKLIQDGGVLLSNLVTGPASSTTGRVATFNGTTGKLIQDGGILLSSLSTTSHTHLTSIYGGSPQTVSSGGTLTLTLSANISPGSHLRIIWGSNTNVYFRSDVFMMQFNGSDHFAVLEKTIDAVSASDVTYRLSCRLGTTSTTGNYTGSQITFHTGMSMSMAGAQTAVTLYVQQIFLITGA